ncbi:16S rRNA (guanine(966)-N(2))-methyltransferase RsmD [Aquabacterium sp. A08]|uniref:16S rRNA (guanine(966)-N(2))-methyltransferase RsmD n=1 Tax=Aquabacterium sp. A08 TaxID=2718532 RepID=UPI00141F24E0|nr:16S rRNA (guanine(966)-N(2))-methyltransferase RsmD [Aquabacterium sp. A08]NIC42152.1 16S rRNA (guanine(966)-N(2))-methyltransferase RsmD [Aquabacterium sp. A08]
MKGAPRTTAGEVRIIGGQWKRSKLTVPVRPGLRPTPDRVRETLFNWLGQDLRGLRCLDAFAGSGALGFEAASRGAVEVLMLELDPGLAAHLRSQAQRLQASQVRVQTGDALAGLRQAPAGAWDVVFLDPPFGDAAQGGNAALYLAALQAARPLLRPDGQLYLEAPRAWGDEELQSLGWHCHRRGRAGTVHHHLLTLTEAGTAPGAGDNPAL